MSFFSDVELVPSIEVLAINEQFDQDSSPNKVNLVAQTYRTAEGISWVLPVVQTAEKILANENLNKDYLPILGLESFTTAATKLLLGEDSSALADKRAIGIQTISATGALRVGAEFLSKNTGSQVFYCSKPTWNTQISAFVEAGFNESRTYRYWSDSKLDLDIDGLLEDLNNAPEKSIIILQVCGHNPTGCDPTKEQWKQIADVMEKRKLFPFFDAVYQGYITGDYDEDSWVVRYFVSRGFELMCAQSFAKNFGLYSERIGNLVFVVNSRECIDQIKSQLTLICRAMYSSPPSHGARIVSLILNDISLFEQWKEQLKTIASRITNVRESLAKELQRLGTPGNWSHIVKQKGMFCFTGLTKNQATIMRQNYHIYMSPSGRFSMVGITPANVEYVARAVHETVRSIICLM